MYPLFISIFPLVWISLRMFMRIPVGPMCESMQIWHLKDKVDEAVCCVCVILLVCVGWPGHEVCHAPRAPPAPLSEKPVSPCHRCLVGPSLKAPGFWAPGQCDPSSLPAPHWAPPGCSCTDTQNTRGDLSEGEIDCIVHSTCYSFLVTDD